MWLCVSMTRRVQKLVCHVTMPQDTILLMFFNYLKNVKVFLAHGLRQQGWTEPQTGFGQLLAESIAVGVCSPGLLGEGRRLMPTSSPI